MSNNPWMDWLIGELSGEVVIEGGVGSGHWGHLGRPGKRGGSRPRRPAVKAGASPEEIQRAAQEILRQEDLLRQGRERQLRTLRDAAQQAYESGDEEALQRFATRARELRRTMQDERDAARDRLVREVYQTHDYARVSVEVSGAREMERRRISETVNMLASGIPDTRLDMRTFRVRVVDDNVRPRYDHRRREALIPRSADVGSATARVFGEFVGTRRHRSRLAEGFEALYRDPVRLAMQDPQLFGFILSYLHGRS